MIRTPPTGRYLLDGPNETSACHNAPVALRVEPPRMFDSLAKGVLPGAASRSGAQAFLPCRLEAADRRDRRRNLEQQTAHRTGSAHRRGASAHAVRGVSSASSEAEVAGLTPQHSPTCRSEARSPTCASESPLQVPGRSRRCPRHRSSRRASGRPHASVGRGGGAHIAGSVRAPKPVRAFRRVVLCSSTRCEEKRVL